MARKRMFDQEILSQDSFIDLSIESKALYFLLGIEADDEGFVAPKRILRLYGGTVENIQELIKANFLIPFESGVVLIVDFNRNNYLNKSRITETIYIVEKQQVFYNEQTKKYQLV